MLVSVSLLLMAATWPAGLDPADAARVAQGDTVEKRSLDNGSVRYTLVARIEAPLASVVTAARDVCAAVQKGKDAPKVTFLSKEGVEKFLQAGGTDLANAALRGGTMSCAEASKLARYYVLADAEGKFPFPASSTLLRVDASIDADGALLVKTLQMLGGVGGSHVDSQRSFVSIDAEHVASIERGVFKLPSMVPDFLARGMLDNDEGRKAWRQGLADLQQRAQKLKATRQVTPSPSQDAR